MSAMKHFEQQSYYELLEVPVSASQEQILDAYARAMEMYSPDSIAVYTLAEPEALEALRERLTQAMEVLCALEQRLEYDQKMGVTRSPEELVRLRAESLKRAAEVKPEVQAQPAAEEEVVLEVLTGEEVVEPAAVPAVPTPAAVPLPPMAARPGVLSRSLTPAPLGGLKPAIHARPMAPVARHGSAVPPPLPPRNGARSPVHLEAESARAAPLTPPLSARPSGQQLSEAPVLAETSAIATAESALAFVSAKARDSRTRLKTVVDIPSDAEFNGELLRRVREGRNLSLQMLADRTRISSRHVENIEADRYDILPASVYLRGMLMSIARELGLDPLRVSRSYMGLVASGEKKHR